MTKKEIKALAQEIMYEKINNIESKLNKEENEHKKSS